MGQTEINRIEPTSGMRKLTLGRLGEDRAAEFLHSRGMIILERNFRCARGEIDLIARDGDTVVFVEVKTRRNLALGSPLEAVTPAKLARIGVVARTWLSRQGRFFPSIRIDVVGVVMSDPPEFLYVRDAR